MMQSYWQQRLEAMRIVKLKAISGEGSIFTGENICRQMKKATVFTMALNMVVR